MTTTVLKLIALLAMIIDHIGYFIPNTPYWFGWIGRIAAPLFIFCVVWGYSYTRDIKKYLIRLYSFSVGMSILSLIINLLYNDTYRYITSNFFAPLFLIAFIIYLINNKNIKGLIVLFLWQFVSFALSVILVEFIQLPYLNDVKPLYVFYGSLFGNIFLVEGGILFVAIGLLLYFTKNNKKMLSIMYILISILSFFLFRRLGYDRGFVSLIVPFADYQWMMIAALPLMLLYNNKKGIGLKYFFYIFYPVHIIVLYIIGNNLR
ncbi:MAG: TraX family protein [Bacilli bacterium]